MAKKGKLGQPFKLCAPGDKACSRDGAPLPSVGFRVAPSFRYTTLTAQPPRTAADRRARGCEESPPGKFTGRLKNGVPDNYCGATSPPCGSAKEMRSSCPVQLMYLEGKPALRFCVRPQAPGFVVPVQSPEQAEAIARRACAKWPNKIPKIWPENFFEKNAPEIVSAARTALPKGNWGTPGLGEMRQRNGGGLGVAAVLIAGGVAALLAHR